MTATETLARWREVATWATEGPWAPWLDQDGAKHMQGRLMVGNADAVIPDGETWIEGVDVNPIAECYTPEDLAFIATSRTALPALLAFAEAVLAWADHMEASAEAIYASSEGDDDIVNRAETLRGDALYIRDLAERHLGGAR